MKDNDFKESLKISTPKLPTPELSIDDLSIETLYLYTNNSLNEIFYFLRDFYQESSEENMLEADNTKPSHAESYYYSLRYELSDAYSNYLDGNLNIEEFQKQFDKVCLNYKTNPLNIYKTHDSVAQAKEKAKKSNIKSIVDNLETEADSCWKKIEQDRQNQK